MASVNKAIVLGNLGRDPETRYTADGTAITSLSVATTRRWKDARGEQQEETEWHRIACFGRIAEIAGEYLRKGRPVYVEGRLRTRKWTDKDGNEKYTTEIVAENLVLLGGGRNDEEEPPAPEGRATRTAARASQQAARQGKPQPRGGIADMDDDIPF
jgi:single-strand DNA-binding protein